MAPSRIGLRRVFSTTACLTFIATIAAAQQDPFQQAQQPGANSDPTASANTAGNPADRNPSSTKNDTKAKTEPEFVVKTDAEWRRILTREQFVVTRLKGTEPAFTGKYATGHYRGTFLCVCCGAELFDAETKFESGTGWPSFWQPINAKAVTYQVDNSELEPRTEVNCRRCGAHLGHVFNDGPPPTGLRFCMNSIALKLKPLQGTSVNRASTNKSRSRPKSKTKAKTSPKSKPKRTSQLKKSTEDPPDSSPRDSDPKASGKDNQSPRSTSDER
jgi:peptide-methionine (R)-S-oxide reductase